MNVPLYKVASFELVDLPLIRHIAKTGKPIIMSTGMASLLEIKEAVAAAKRGGAKKIILLKRMIQTIEIFTSKKLIKNLINFIIYQI